MAKGRRHVLAAAQESLTPPDALAANQSVVRVVKPEGNNLYACELPGGKPVVLELAQRFRNTIWIKRGGFVLAERYEGRSEETRAEGEIVNVVRDERLWRKQPYWPKQFPKVVNDSTDDEDEATNMGKMPPSDSDDD